MTSHSIHILPNLYIYKLKFDKLFILLLDSYQSFPNHFPPTSQTYNRDRCYLSFKLNANNNTESVLLCVQRLTVTSLRVTMWQ